MIFYFCIYETPWVSLKIVVSVFKSQNPNVGILKNERNLDFVKNSMPRYVADFVSEM